jgi:hypothetical protein
MFMIATTVKSSQLNPGPPQNGSRPMITSIKNSRSRASNQNSKLSTARYWPLCGRALLSRPHLSIALVGQTLTSGGNHIESLVDLKTPPTIIRHSSLSWPSGLQQNIFCSARMQNHCTRETRKTTHLGTPRATWIFLGVGNASLPMSKCLHLFYG